MSVSSALRPWEEARREAEARRAAEDERRGPAFWSVFCRVISLASSSVKGEGACEALKVGVKVGRVGEIWAGSPVPAPDGPEKEGFLRMPGMGGC